MVVARTACPAHKINFQLFDFTASLVHLLTDCNYEKVYLTITSIEHITIENDGHGLRGSTPKGMVPDRQNGIRTEPHAGTVRQSL